MLLYIIRHGDPIYDPDSLTEKGHAQARALADRLCVHGLDKIFCSPMIRAQQTAAPTAERLGITPVIEPWTGEDLAWRDFAGRREDGSYGWAFHVDRASYKTEAVFSLGDKWYEAPEFSYVNAKAGYERIQKASDEFTSRLGYVREGMLYRAVNPTSDRVAVFCHQGFGTTWLSHLLAVPAPLFWSSFDITHSSITIIDFGDENKKDRLVAPVCIALSDTSHIYQSGLPLQFNNCIDI